MTSAPPRPLLGDRASAKPPRRVGLDALRAGAATAVVVSHVAFVTGVVNPQRWGSPLRQILPRLDVGVPIFFVLSGLLIARPFIRSAADDSPQAPLGRYLLRRGARIYPLYWVVLAATFALSEAALPSVPRLLSFVSLTHIYRPDTAIGPITQSWSLATELSFYLLVPLWFAASRWVLNRRGITDRSARLRWMAISLLSWVAVALVWRVGVVAVTDTFDYQRPGAIDVRGALLTWLPNHLDNFAIGVAFAIALELKAASTKHVRPVNRLGNPLVLRLGAYVVAAAALWIASAHLGLPALHTGFDGGQTLARHALFWVVAALVVAPTALLAGAGPARRPVPVAQVAKAAGLASYGVYLWHQLVGERWLERRGNVVFNTAFPTSLVVVMVVSTALAAAGYWLVERWPQPMVDAVLEAPPTDAARPPRQLGPSPVLDGLRGASILAVLGTHIIFVDPGRDHWLLRGGFLGVDVFLVLSGFLISATLLRERDRTTTVAIGGFLRRRADRLLPPMVVFIAIHAVVVILLGDPLREEALQAGLAVTFLSNWQLSFGHQPPFDLVHLWSLAVEGQLYVLCGLAVYAARRRIDRTTAVIGALCAAAFAVAVWRLVQYRMGVDLEALYQRTDVRADSMIIGGLGAVLWRARVVPDVIARRVGALGAVAILVSWWTVKSPDGSLFGGGFTLIALAAVAMILAALSDTPSAVFKVASWAPLRAIGRMSYSLYLWHLPVYRWTARAIPDVAMPLRFTIAVVASFVAAALSYRFVEQPFLERRRRAQTAPTAQSAQVEQSASSAGPESVNR